ncbi:SDR family oxidoreductase [Hamadaea tsunoensis]|uniref:SDR family oxidoreductase n=1 Tax=Hamadaea tsunoensis TaxID=53368 RepID=UPI000487AACB|nr:SDR family oxidoreductase [Hamadaea tsunoensis]
MTNYENLSGRVAVVTGAASGMGAATADLLGAAGANVVLLARRAAVIAERAEKIVADGGRALAVATDVTSPEAVASAAERIRAEFGRVDLVVNSAGVMLPNPIEDGRSDEWQRMIDTNFTGVLNVIRAFTPDLLAAAADGKPADLVNISSIGAHVAFPTFAVYGATKAALTHLSATLRTELGPRGVRVTNLEPGLTDTELSDHISNPEISGMVGQMFDALGGLSAAEIADLVGYIVSRPKHVNLRQVIVLPTAQA